MLLRDGRAFHETHQSTILVYTISFVNDSIHQNTFKCEALLTGRTIDSNTASDSVTVTISVEGKSIIAYGYYSTLPHSSPTTY